jgi:hypothetical protein
VCQKRAVEQSAGEENAIDTILDCLDNVKRRRLDNGRPAADATEISRNSSLVLQQLLEEKTQEIRMHENLVRQIENAGEK